MFFSNAADVGVDVDGVDVAVRVQVQVQVNVHVKVKAHVRAPLGLLLACGLIALGCGKRERQHRTGDAAAVERITAPVLVDGATPKGSADELEPNDTDDTAMELALGHSVHGRIDPLDSDVDSYRIEVTTAGVLALELTAVKDSDLSLELHDAGGSVIAKSDRLGETKEGIPYFGVAK